MSATESPVRTASKRIVKIVLPAAGLLIATGARQAAWADTSPDYRYPTTFNDLTSTGSNPGHRPARLLSDEAFYGKWDAATSSWKTPGLFDYAGRAGLKTVETCVKRGDYEAAGEALPAYFRQRDGIELPELPDASEPRTKLRAELFMEQVYFRHGVEPYLQFDVTAKEQAYTVNVTKYLQERYMLMARKKGVGAAVFNSREAREGRPLLRLTIAGKRHVIEPEADATVQCAPGKKHGKAATLVVRGSMPGVAVDDQTCRALLSFDLTSIDRSAVERAELILHGKTDASAGTMAVLLVPTSAPLSAANEANIQWENLTGNQFSYEGLSGLSAWRNPQKGNPHRYFFVTGIVRFASYPSIIAMYRKTGDERYARRAIQIYLDYVEYQMFNRLDDGSRAVNLVRPSQALYKSPSMTPRALQIMIEHAWRVGNWYSMQKNWYSNHNFGSSYIGGCAALAYAFPELRDVADWWRITNDRAVVYTSRGVYGKDHSFREPNTPYGFMVLGAIDQYRTLAVKANVDLPPKLEANLRGIAWYALDVLDPSGIVYPYGDIGSARGFSMDVIKQIGLDHDDPGLVYVATGGKEGEPPTRTPSTWYPDTKLGIMLSDWTDRNALGLFVNARSNGGAHAHPNALSLCAYAYGQQLIDDTYYYPEFNRLRKGVRTREHNTIEINGKSQGRGAADGGMLLNPRFTRFAGFTDASRGFRHSRRIVLIEPARFWIVSDHLSANQQPDAIHRYNQTWHPRPTSRVSIDPETAIAVTDYPSKSNIKIVPADPEAITAELADGWWSNDRNRYVSYLKAVKGSTTFDTVLYPMVPGQMSDVAVTRLKTAVRSTVATALAIRIDQRMGYYYLSHEANPADRAAGPLSTDARMAYVEQDPAGQLTTLIMEAGSRLQYDQQNLVEASAVLGDISVLWDATHQTITVDTVSARLPETLKIHAPFAVARVLLRGNEVTFTQQKGVVILRN